MRSIFLSSIVAGACLLGACGSDPQVDSASLVESATVLNGINFNGVSFNGINYNGVAFNGIKYNGVSYNGATIGNAQVSNGQLSISGNWGANISGTNLIGLQFMPQGDDGSIPLLRIDTVTQDSTTGLWEYGVSYQGSDGSWSPICGTDATTGNAVLSIPLAGKFDPTTGDAIQYSDCFTFACVNTALGKCVVWGYKPWASEQECRNRSDCRNDSLFEWHAACTRMVRADYCGNGVPHTRNGTPINIWDVFGIQTQAQTSWQMEAEWTSQGAKCIRHTRWVQADTTASMTDLQYVQQNCPDRLASNAYGNSCDTYRSDFFTQYGYNTSLTQRRLLRNESANNQ